jgi:hypothetical protein
VDKKQTRTVIAALASPVALIATGALVYQASFAAFTAQTSNDDNRWATTEAITLDTDRPAALFVDVPEIVPGYSKAECINVVPNSGPESSVRLYAAASTDPVDAELQDELTLTVEAVTGAALGTAPSEVDCRAATPVIAVASGTLADLVADRAEWSEAAAGAWAVPAASTAARTYRVTATFNPTVDANFTQAELDALQGKTAGISLVWERRTDTP